MKLVAITGGIGNQMFIYAFMVRLSQMHKAYLFHPYKDNSRKYGHTGFQLEEIFSLRLADAERPFCVSLLGWYWQVMRLFPKKIRPLLLRLIGVKEVHVDNNFVFYPKVFQSQGRNELLMGTWQSEKYFKGAEEEVLRAFAFKEELLNKKTQQLIVKLDQCESVSIHVRRDDYLSPTYVQGFGGICTKSYYSVAIEFIKERTNQPLFFVFSDDIDWCKANLDVQNAFFVDWNQGKESWQDMFLMSKCKHNIIANSSCSWWGAWLNKNPDKIVVAPEKWWNGIKDDVVPETWIRLSDN